MTYGRRCKCKGRLLRDEEYDAYYCITCGAWQEDKCGDEDCEFCKNRPSKKDLEK